MVDIRYQEGGQELLEKVAPLWNRLNEHHQNISKHFSQHFHQMTYAQRKENWLQNMKSGMLRVDLVQTKDSNELLGYCVSICNQDIGEIESIYVGDTYRNIGIGHCLMKRAMDWMERQSVKTKRVSVAVGNEQVFQFYGQYGFLPRAIALEQVSRKPSNRE